MSNQQKTIGVVGFSSISPEVRKMVARLTAFGFNALPNSFEALRFVDNPGWHAFVCVDDLPDDAALQEKKQNKALLQKLKSDITNTRLLPNMEELDISALRAEMDEFEGKQKLTKSTLSDDEADELDELRDRLRSLGVAKIDLRWRKVKLIAEIKKAEKAAEKVAKQIEEENKKNPPKDAAPEKPKEAAPETPASPASPPKGAADNAGAAPAAQPGDNKPKQV